MPDERRPLGSPATAPVHGWDTHMHLVPPAVISAARAGRFDLGIDERSLQIDRARVPLGKIVSVDALLARLDSDRLTGGFVAIPPTLFRAEQPEAQRPTWADLVNDSLGELLAGHSGRLFGLAFVPAEDPDLATRLVTELDDSWAGVTLGTELNGRRLHQSEYDRLWDALAERRLPVLLHPGHPPDPRLDEFYLTNLLGYPYETTLAAAHLVFGGALERHPDLDVILSHGGAAVATLAGRWQLGAATDRPGVVKLQREPFEYVRRFYVDTVVHSADYIDFLVGTVGADRLLLGSDWPFPMGTARADADIDHLDEKSRHAIRVTNVERVFRRVLGAGS